MMEFRRFVLQRHEDESGVSGTGVVAEGVEFSNGVIALHWTSEFPTSVVFHHRGMESVEHVHGHGGKTEIVWLDEAQPFWAGLTHAVEIALNEAEDANGGDYVLLSRMAEVAVETMRRHRDLSNVSVGGERLSWADVAAHNEERAQRAERWERILSDLDRCEHGRHEGDDCSLCGGPSRGNPIALEHRRQIGYNLAGQPIVIPPLHERRASKDDPAAWEPGSA